MSSTPLAIEWHPQPLEIDSNHDNALVIRDPVMVIATALNLPAPSDEVRQQYSRASLQQFWSLLQAGIKEELERQLGQIYNQASQYQEPNMVHLQFVQQAMDHITMLVLEIKFELEKVMKETTIPVTVLAGDQDMDWEWTFSPMQIPNLMGDFNSKLPKLTPVPN